MIQQTHLDPIGGQGANNNYRQIKVLLSEFKNNTAGDYSEAWMNATFDKYFNEIGYNTNRFNNTLLEPLTKAGQRMLISQYGSTGKEGDDSIQQMIADAFVENFDNPNNITDTFHDDAKAKAWINKQSGGTCWCYRSVWKISDCQRPATSSFWDATFSASAGLAFGIGSQKRLSSWKC